MVQEKENTNKPDVNNETIHKTSVKRRTLLKALAGIPVLGFFAYELGKKKQYDQDKRNRILKELDLEDINAPVIKSSAVKGDLLRIGIIGFGNRAVAHANALGYMHPDDVAKHRESGTLEDWLYQDDLNIAVTGVCDVFDLHAENAMVTYTNEKGRAGGAKPSGLPVKRYMSYQEMLADKDIDAVVIATPDHHHATISIAAAKAGKHIYCEKAVAHNMNELYEVYDTIKSSDIVYQLGHQAPHNITYNQAREILKRNILGKITLVEATSNRNSADGAWIRDKDKDGNPKPGDEKTIDWNQWLGHAPKVPFSLDRFYNWTKFFDYDIGVLGQLFTHDYDAINQLLNIGIPRSVVSSGGIYFWKDNRDMPDTFHSVFEYPQHDLSVLYSSTLSNSRPRGRVFMGNDASMEIGSVIRITADAQSERYKKQIKEGLIDPRSPMISFNPKLGKVDAVTSATEKYYAERGLTSTMINGRIVDLTHLHFREWINCIRNGGTPSDNIERAFDEGVTCLMAHRAYLEKRRVMWDPVKREII